RDSLATGIGAPLRVGETQNQPTLGALHRQRIAGRVRLPRPHPLSPSPRCGEGEGGRRVAAVSLLTEPSREFTRDSWRGGGSSFLASALLAKVPKKRLEIGSNALPGLAIPQFRHAMAASIAGVKRATKAFGLRFHELVGALGNGYWAFGVGP